jgi:hypothetical protein
VIINNWGQRVSWEEVCRRHAARTRWNSLRRFLAEDRRRRLLELVLEVGGLPRGVQRQLAALLQVDPSTISKDLKKLLPLERPCPTCGVLRPRRWLDEADP